MLTSRACRALLLMLVSALTGAQASTAVEVENYLVTTAVTGDTGNARSNPSALSHADGRYVLIDSVATNLVSGLVDVNNASDVYLYDRIADTTTLVSRSAASATTTANRASISVSISADGEWVLFQSTASDLVAGTEFVEPNASHVYLYRRSTGLVTLVSRSVVAPGRAANGSSWASSLSSDGEWALFASYATDIASGVSDVNAYLDLFLFSRSSGTVTLVSRAASSPTIPAIGNILGGVLSADGEWVLFSWEGESLVAEVTDDNFNPDVYLFQRSTGAMTLVSRSITLPGRTANSASQHSALSADGEWALFSSKATDLVAGVTDTGQFDDVFLYRRSTGEVKLVTRAVDPTATTGNGMSFSEAISPDGEWVVISSRATNLVAGVVDGNNARDIFLYRTSTGALRLVSRSATSGALTANGSSWPIAISADGGSLLFSSSATNLVAGVSDANSAWDAFLHDVGTGETSLVSRSAASASATPSGTSGPSPVRGVISADGEWAVFESTANLVSGVVDSNDTWDAFLYRRSSDTVSLVSRAAAVRPNGAAASFDSRPAGMSEDGDWMLLESRARNLVSGFVDANGIGADVFLHHRSSGTTILVSRSAASSTTSGNGESLPISISADGEWVLFRSWATNLVTGIIDANNTSDVFLYRRSTGEMALVSRVPGSTTTGNGESYPISVGMDGDLVLFGSRASNLVAGVADTNNTWDVFLLRRSTGEVSLISHSASSPTVTGDGLTYSLGMTPDGEYVVLNSFATNLVAGFADTNANYDAFLYRRSTASMTLLSRSAGSAMTTANGFTVATGMSIDGESILLFSQASDLASGITDNNGLEDAFLYRRSTGGITLISSAATNPLTTGNGYSEPTAISADGEWSLMWSNATNLVEGSDTNGLFDVFLFRRSTAAMTLVSRSASSPLATANGGSVPGMISRDGQWVTFGSNASDLVAGLSDSNGSAQDVYVYHRETARPTLLSRSAASATSTANGSSFGGWISADGSRVLIGSDATDLVENVVDDNGSWDVFISHAPGAGWDRVFVNGFEALR